MSVVQNPPCCITVVVGLFTTTAPPPLYAVVVAAGATYCEVEWYALPPDKEPEHLPLLEAQQPTWLLAAYWQVEPEGQQL